MNKLPNLERKRSFCPKMELTKNDHVKKSSFQKLDTRMVAFLLLCSFLLREDKINCMLGQRKEQQERDFVHVFLSLHENEIYRIVVISYLDCSFTMIIPTFLIIIIFHHD